MSIIKLPNAYLARDVYKGLVDQKHFLVQLDEQFDWCGLAEPLSDLGENDAGGRPRYPSVLMLKMLFVAFLFNLSDRETESEATNHLLVKYFIGLPINERSPDHTSLCRFREVILLKKGTCFFTNLFHSLLAQAKERSISFGVVSSLDATHTLANIDAYKKDDSSSPRDPDASWGCKGNETKTTTDGTRVQIPKYFFGYKAHILAETTHNLIMGFHVTPGNISDIDGGDILIHQILTDDQRSGIHVLCADKGYGCPIWINLLEKYTGIMTAFSLPEWMYKKGPENLKLKWLNYKADEGRNAFKRERYKIEQVNGDLKENHGMRRCRYLGLNKYFLQTAMSSIAHNLKIYIKLLTGARFKPI